MNVAVEAPGIHRWALTERGESAVVRDASHVAIGGSVMRRCEDGRIVVDVDERCAPWTSHIRGRITLVPQLELDHVVHLDDRREHEWRPRIPLARVEVDLVEPRLRFSGTGYLDENAGARALETAFARWSWARVANADAVGITYDVELRSGARRSHGMRVTSRGIAPDVREGDADLGRTRFGLPRRLPREGAVVRTLEDGPFYARSMITTTLDGAPAHGMHESLCLDRFSSRWVQMLLPFRMRVEAP